MPYYVSPKSSTVSVDVVSVNGGTPPPWVPGQENIPLTFGGSNPNCTVSGQVATCTITIPAPPGRVVYQMATYAQVSPSPAPLTILDYGEAPIQISEGKNNDVNFTLSGVVHGATVTLEGPLVANQPTSVPVLVQAFDASGSLITGTAPYDSPFKITDGDPYGSESTLLVVNGGKPTKAPQISSPTDVVSLNYGGFAIGLYNIEASGTGKAGAWTQASAAIEPQLQPIVIPGSFVDTGNPNDPNYGQTTLDVPLQASIQETLSELGRTDQPYSACPSKGKPTTCLLLLSQPQIYTPCQNGANSIASFSPPQGQTNGYNYTIKGLKPGVCLEQFDDGPLYPQHEPPPLGNPLSNGEVWVVVTPSPAAAAAGR
jgi:hypothetical protein